MNDQQPTRQLGSQFWRLWASSATSYLGTGMSMVALALLAVDITPSAFLVASVLAVREGAVAICGVPAGSLVDRIDRRRAMIGADLVRAAALLGLAGLIAVGHANIWVLFVVGIILGAADAVFDPASYSLLPAVVHDDDLDKANGRMTVAEDLMLNFLGSPIGALLYSVAAGIPFLFDAVSFLGSAAILSSIKVEIPAEAPEEDAQLWRHIREGLREIRHAATLRILAWYLMLVSLLTGAGAATIVLLIRRTLHLSSFEYGLLFGIGAIGGLIAGFLVERVVSLFGRTQTLVIGVIGTGVASIITGFSPNFTTAVLGWTLFGFSLTLAIVTSRSLRQDACPDHLRGRVFGAFGTLIAVGNMLGALCGGAVAQLIGNRAPLIGAGLGLVILGAAVAIAFRRHPIVAAPSAELGEAVPEDGPTR